MEMLEAIQEAIEKNLPKQVGDQLRERLEKANQLEVEISNLKTEKQRLQEEIAKDASIIERLRADIAEHSSLDHREKAIREREIEVRIKEARLDERLAGWDRLYELYKVPFQNRMLRESLITTERVRDPDTQYYNSDGSSSFGFGGEHVENVSHSRITGEE